MSSKEELKFFIDTLRKAFLELCQVRFSSRPPRLDLPNEGRSFAIYFLPANPLHRSFEQKLGDKKKRQIDGGESGIRTVECSALYRLAWACSVTGNKPLIRISVPARSYKYNLRVHGQLAPDIFFRPVGNQSRNVKVA